MVTNKYQKKDRERIIEMLLFRKCCFCPKHVEKYSPLFSLAAGQTHEISPHHFLNTLVQTYKSNMHLGSLLQNTSCGTIQERVNTILKKRKRKSQRMKRY